MTLRYAMQTQIQDYEEPCIEAFPRMQYACKKAGVDE